jgi:hypothetical protein
MNKLFITFFALGLSMQYAFAQSNIIKNNDPHIHYMGRVAVTDSATVLSWAGNSATINFNGTGVDALLKDEGGENYMKVIVDGNVLPDIKLDSTKHMYTLVKHLPAAHHTLQLYKRNEWVFGKTLLYQFVLNDKGTIDKTPVTKKRKIEFFGNSITCGYAVLDTEGKDRGSSPFEDNYISYAAITARHFDAEYSCIARSGIGVLVSWFPMIMPEMYDLLDPSDPNSKWDFTKYTPDVVVINLFQNDSWIVLKPDNPEFKHRFGAKPPSPEQIISAYYDMVKNIRGKYPKAQIICALGSMDATKEGSPWPGYINSAVNQLNDKKIKTHFFPYKNTNGHPSKAEQQAMADDLISYIEKHIKW